jgi:hypothetical protein
MDVITEHHRRLVTTLVVLAGIALSVLLLCAALAGRGDGTPAATTGSGTASAATTPPNPASLPDLDDPIVRRRFVCSFAAGSFGISPELPYELVGGLDCRGLHAAGRIYGESGTLADAVGRRVEQVRVAAEGWGPGLEPLLEATRKAVIAQLLDPAEGP